VLGALVSDLPRAHVVQITLVCRGVFLVIGERCADIALLLRELIEQSISAHDRLDVLTLIALVARGAQRKLLCRMPVAAVAVSRREQRFVFADQAPVARRARFFVMLAQQLDGVSIAALIDVRARDVGANCVGAQPLADVQARLDGTQELSHVAAQPAAAIQRFQSHVRTAADAVTRRVLARDPVRVAEPEVVFTDLVVDITHDEQTLLTRVVVLDLRQQLEKRAQV